MKTVALVQMPWGILQMPYAGIGLLKSVLEEKEIQTDVYYLNIRFAKYIGTETYFDMLPYAYAIGELLFSQCLFGEKGTQELCIDYVDILKSTLEFNPKFGLFLRKHKKVLLSLINELIPQFIKQCLETIPWGSYKIVGFKSMMGSQLPSLMLARKIKERWPDVKIVFGGAGTRGEMGIEILRGFEWVDYVIDGDAEESLPALARNINEGRLYESIPGVSYRQNNIIKTNGNIQLKNSLDELPVPDHSDFFKEIEEAGFREYIPYTKITFESSRGCWWAEKAQCTFCAVCNGLTKYRTKSSHKILDELIQQSERYKIKNFYSTDCVLNLSLFDTLIPDLIKKNLDLNIFFEVRSTLSREQVGLLYAAGVRDIQPGIESLNTDILRLMSKGVTAIQNIQSLKFYKELNMELKWNLLYRVPGEEKRFYDETIELLPSICHLKPPEGLIPIVLNRFSPYFTNPEKYGIKEITPHRLYKLVYPENRVNINNIVWTFEYTSESFDIYKSYFSELENAVTAWKDAFSENKYYCEYMELDSNYVEIYDNRPVTFKDANNKPKSYILEGLGKTVLLFCDEIRFIDDILTHINQSTGLIISKDKVLETIDDLRTRRLLLEESSKYLCLATRKNN